MHRFFINTLTEQYAMYLDLSLCDEAFTWSIYYPLSALRRGQSYDGSQSSSGHRLASLSELNRSRTRGTPTECHCGPGSRGNAGTALADRFLCLLLLCCCCPLLTFHFRERIDLWNGNNIKSIKYVCVDLPVGSYSRDTSNSIESTCRSRPRSRYT